MAKLVGENAREMDSWLTKRTPRGQPSVLSASFRGSTDLYAAETVAPYKDIHLFGRVGRENEQALVFNLSNMRWIWLGHRGPLPGNSEQQRILRRSTLQNMVTQAKQRLMGSGERIAKNVR